MEVFNPHGRYFGGTTFLIDTKKYVARVKTMLTVRDDSVDFFPIFVATQISYFRSTRHLMYSSCHTEGDMMLYRIRPSCSTYLEDGSVRKILLFLNNCRVMADTYTNLCHSVTWSSLVTSSGSELFTYRNFVHFFQSTTSHRRVYFIYISGFRIEPRNTIS